jgi:ABC-2 type transport system permease protein
MIDTLRHGWSRGGIEIKQFFRERESVVFTFAFPIVMLMIFGAVFKDEIFPGVSFRQYFTAGMIATGVVLTSFQSLAISLSMERDDGTLKRLRGTPLPPASFFLGKIFLVLFTSLVQTATLLLLGRLTMGLKLPATPELWLRFAWVFLLGVTAGTVLGIAFSSVPRSARSAPAVVSPIVIVLQFISGVYFVYNQLPSWMQNIASVFPLKWLAQGMRSVFLPNNFANYEVGHSWALSTTAAVLAGWALIGLGFCVKTFRWQRHDAG